MSKAKKKDKTDKVSFSNKKFQISDYNVLNFVQHNDKKAKRERKNCTILAPQT